MDDASFAIKPYKEQATSYAAINKKVELVLNKTGKKVQFTMLDGFGEKVGISTKKDERSSHTALMMRNQVEFRKTANDIVPIKINLDSLPLSDIEQLRSAVKEHEGKVPTEIRFEHPESELKPPHEKYVVIDLLAQMAFFFPSEAI